MQQNIHCHKCRAGYTALYLKEEILENGTMLHSIVCRLCGTRIKTKTVTTLIGSARKPAPAPVVIDEKPKKERPKKLKLAKPQYTYSPCHVHGCTGQIVEVLNQSGLCEDCGKAVRRWERGKRSTPPQVVKSNGHWVKNTGLLLGEDVVVKKKKRAPKPKVAKLSKQIESDLVKLSRRGNKAARQLLVQIG
ncbi:hypothetical protein MJO47_09260 [Desulfuromonas sp. KJ2020]|uniref:hypothetical protein n=1 Tax=Desulfuromonas sp. KJ2020 TaxID=2919173 RepID=UPI0020A7319F|nr:hypothetical protein [Desulfuromonas sp. KJ2020]MCP3177285.1 hypothetical protein [Desulfuromonas sp. KJ2020]